MGRIRILACALLALVCLSAAAATPSGSTTPRPDALSWTLVSSSTGGPDVDYADVIYAAGKFIAVGKNNSGRPAIVESSDGLTWTAIYVGTKPGTLDTVAYGNGIYVAIGSSGTFSSSDGINWNIEPALPNRSSGDVVFGNGRFVAFTAPCPTSKCIVDVSTDGKTWTQRAAQTGSGALAFVMALAFDGTRFVTMGAPNETAADHAPVYTSCDGINWVHSSDIDLLDANVYLMRTVATGLVAVADIGCTADDPASCGPDGTAFITGTDASHLKVTSSGYFYGSNITDVIFAGSNYYAAVDGAVYSSPDAVTWTFPTGTPSASINALAAGGGQLIAVGNGGDIISAAASTAPPPTGGACTDLPAVVSSVSKGGSSGGRGGLNLMTLAGLLGLLFLRRQARA